MPVTDDVTVTNRSTNWLAIVSVVAGVLAIGSILGLGIGAPAAFAVGAGHVSLQQIRRRGGRGRTIALAGLVIGYAVATWSLVVSLTYLPDLFAAL